MYRYVHTDCMLHLSATTDEQVRTAAMAGNRPPLDEVVGPDDLLPFAKKWIVQSWHELPDERPSFDGKQLVYVVKVYKTVCRYLFCVFYKCDFSDCISLTMLMSFCPRLRFLQVVQLTSLLRLAYVST